jgi:2-(3-amino-3-carboxypropyl)histidine synthase
MVHAAWMIILQSHLGAICWSIMDTVVLVSSCAAHFKCYSSFHLVPIDQTTIKTLYIFVEIEIDSSHLVETNRLNFPNDRQAFRGQLLEYEDGDARTPAGQKIGETRHLQIEGPSSEGEVEPSAPTELTRLALVSTIQFVAALQRLKEDLTSPYSDAGIPPDVLLDGAQSEASAGDVSKSSSGHRLWTGSYEATIPRSKPLSPGEILGCTAPIISDVDALM